MKKYIASEIYSEVDKTLDKYFGDYLKCEFKKMIMVEHACIKSQMANFWVGVNCLDLSAQEVAEQLLEKMSILKCNDKLKTI